MSNLSSQSLSSGLEQATVGGGCFWCVEAAFAQVRGVISAISGYAGGHTSSPTYQAICTGQTGHAEVVQVTYDPAQLSYRDVLELFFAVHDPTTLNRQGADVGTQYRSTIMPHNDSQAAIAREVIRELNAEGTFGQPLVTTIEPLTTFYPAEDYHQHYFANHPDQAYCQAVISPKLAKFRQKFGTRLHS